MAETASAHPPLIDRDGEEWRWIDGGYHALNAPCQRDEIEAVWGPVTEKRAVPS